MHQLVFEDLLPNTADYEQFALVKSTGFREYDTRWLFGSEINLAGIQVVGMCLGTMVQERTKSPRIVVGHDYREYSSAIKYALISGLMAAGCQVCDIGMCTTPMAYFAQFALDCQSIAMVTASHNENGWTGIKMGTQRPLTFGPEDIAILREKTYSGGWKTRDGGSLFHKSDFIKQYANELISNFNFQRKLRVAVVCGNGTAGAFAPSILSNAGCEVIEVDCVPDHSFPNYNPNPEDMSMLQVMRNAVLEHKLDVAFGIDGDGDRCGVVDNEGQVIFSDKLGLLLARDFALQKPGCQFVVDVKSTGLFKTDPVLLANGASVDYWMTGHSYIKQRTDELNAVAGFEKSGHFFFRPPLGHGYDDGILSSLIVCQLLNRNPSKSLADLYRSLAVSYSTPTMSPHCDDDKKYAVVERIKSLIHRDAERAIIVADGPIVDVLTINGVRFGFADGSWGLVRASSNKPELVVVCESQKSDQNMRNIFSYIKSLLEECPEVGAFNQTI